MKNKFEKRGDYYAIFANRDGVRMEILVDETDFKTIASRPGAWRIYRAGDMFYARIWIRGVKWTSVFLHRILLNAPADMQIDHVNRNGLDNRRKNLINAS